MTNFSIQRGSRTRFSRFLCGSPIQDELEFGNVDVAFSAERRIQKYPEKSLRPMRTCNKLTPLAGGRGRGAPIQTGGVACRKF